MAGKVFDIDRGWKALRKDLADLKESYVKVGVLGRAAEEAHPDEEGGGALTNVDLAVIHEFGAPAAGIPARPFVSGSYDKHRREYEKDVAQGMAAVFRRTLTVRRMLGLLGAKAARDMKNYVIKGASPFLPNAPAVAARKAAKGHGKAAPRPLIDTGRMVGSVTWAVVSGGNTDEGGRE